jgi:coatomer protein complex subunit alpha (xenin)
MLLVGFIYIGHDGGMVVFKLERERPAFDVFQDVLYYVKDKSIRQYHFHTAKDIPLAGIKRGHPGQAPPPKTLSYNAATYTVMLSTGHEEGEFEVYQLPRDVSRPAEGEPTRGPGLCAVYVARNRFAVVEKGKVCIKDMNNATVKELFPTTKEGKTLNPVQVFIGGGKNIIIQGQSAVILYDTDAKQTLAEVPVTNARYIVWNHDRTMVAIISKHNLIICDSKLEQQCLVHETVKIKSGAWDSSLGVFVYSTLNHIKYTLLNGDHGIIKTIDEPVYLARVNSNLIHVLTRSGKVEVIPFDPTEYIFKLALISRDYEKVLSVIKDSNLVGQAIIAYLREKGFPEIALQFVKEPKTRFDLAIECGNLNVALEMANIINNNTYWERLGLEASRQGNVKTLEIVYQKTKNFDRLSFLYLTIGDRQKLTKMHKIAMTRKDPMSRYHNALYLGNVTDQIHILVEAGQLPLAYLAAQTYGLESEAKDILQLSGLDYAPKMPAKSSLLRAPLMIKRDCGNWPTLNPSQNLFEAMNSTGNSVNGTSSAVATDAVLNESDLQEAGDWGDDDLGLDAEPAVKMPKSSPAVANKESAMEASADSFVDDIDAAEGWGDAELELDELESPVKEFAAPKHGKPLSDNFLNSNVAAYHIAEGSFESAMKLLNQQAGITVFAPLKTYFMNIFQGSRTFLDANANASALVTPLQSSMNVPMVCYQISSVLSQLQETYPIMTASKFAEAMTRFRDILYQTLFIVTSDAGVSNQIIEVVNVCREYLIGLTSMSRRNAGDPKRSMELAAYFTHCGLQPVHLTLALKAAMVQAFKNRSFGTALNLAQRLLAMGPPASFAEIVFLF